jgi:hypothetical protein
MRWISCSARPDDAVMVIFCSLPVPRSLAETLTMPLASMSKVTSICGTPRGAGGMPTRWKRPSVRLSRAISRSPCSTCISTCVWLSGAVEKTSLLRVGIVVLRSMSLVATPPRVSMPSESGVTSSSSMSLTSPLEHAALHRGADRDHLVGVDPLARLLAEEILDQLLDRRHARLAADEHHLVDLPGLEAGVGDRLLAGADRAPDQVFDQLLELGPRELQVEVLGARRVGGDEGQVDLGLLRRGELDLGLLRGFLQTLHGHRVLAEVDPLVALELGEQPVDHLLVDVVAAEVGVAVGGLDLDDPFADLENRDVEGAAAEVEDGDRLVLLLVEAVGERRRRRLVDQPLDVEPGDLAGVLGRLALGVVEVRRHGDHRLRPPSAEVVLRRLLELLQDHRRDLRRAELLAVDVDAAVAVLGALDLVGDHLHLFADFFVATPHEALDRVDGVLGIGHRLALGDLADQTLAGFGEGDNRGGGPAPFGVGENLGLSPFQHGDHAVGGAQVDSDDLAHEQFLLRTRESRN